VRCVECRTIVLHCFVGEGSTIQTFFSTGVNESGAILPPKNKRRRHSTGGAVFIAGVQIASVVFLVTLRSVAKDRQSVFCDGFLLRQMALIVAMALGEFDASAEPLILACDRNIAILICSPTIDPGTC
jgi:hypothetical protein